MFHFFMSQAFVFSRKATVPNSTGLLQPTSDIQNVYILSSSQLAPKVDTFLSERFMVGVGNLQFKTVI